MKRIILTMLLSLCFAVSQIAFVSACPHSLNMGMPQADATEMGMIPCHKGMNEFSGMHISKNCEGQCHCLSSHVYGLFSGAESVADEFSYTLSFVSVSHVMYSAMLDIPKQPPKSIS